MVGVGSLVVLACVVPVCFSACDIDSNGVIDAKELELLDAGLIQGDAATAMIKVRPGPRSSWDGVSCRRLCLS